MEQKMEREKVLVANNLINYADDGIVSKEFIHTQSGSVTLFAFEAGQKLSEHTAPFDVMLQVIDGEAEIMIEGNRHHIKAGEMIMIPQNSAHAVHATARFKMILTMIRG